MMTAMTDYPKPEGYGHGTSDGTMLTNTKGRVSVNPNNDSQSLLTNQRLNEGNGGDPDC